MKKENVLLEINAAETYHLSSYLSVSVLKVVDDLRADLQPVTTWNHTISPTEKLFTALYFLASGWFASSAKTSNSTALNFLFLCSPKLSMVTASNCTRRNPYFSRAVTFAPVIICRPHATCPLIILAIVLLSHILALVIWDLSRSSPLSNNLREISTGRCQGIYQLPCSLGAINAIFLNSNTIWIKMITIRIYSQNQSAIGVCKSIISTSVFALWF